MIRKIRISVILLLVMIFNPVLPDNWRITRFQAPISKQFIAKTKVRSVVGCLLYCSRYYTSVLVTAQDSYCYCLTSYPLNWTGEYVTLTSMMTRVSDPPDCLSKGYGIYSDLGVCIKYIDSTIAKRTWLDAERYCNQDGGYLLNVVTEGIFNVGKDIAKSRVFPDQIYVGGFTTFWDGIQTEYHWTRGGMVDRFWAANEPTFFGPEPCVSIKTQGFNNYGCTNTNPFLCELMLL